MATYLPISTYWSISTFLPIPTYLPNYQPTYLPTNQPTNLPTYLPTYLTYLYCWLFVLLQTRPTAIFELLVGLFIRSVGPSVYIKAQTLLRGLFEIWADTVRYLILLLLNSSLDAPMLEYNLCT